jgi:hypothetical protein
LNEDLNQFQKVIAIEEGFEQFIHRAMLLQGE